MAGESGLSAAAASFLEQVHPRLPEQPIVIALSGGPDSAALAFAVAATGREARAVTVDHRLEASAQMVAAARDVARMLDLAHLVVEADRVGSSEGELREIRLQIFDEITSGGEAVVTGHTRDDLAETVLGNLLRGSGATGLSGIPPVRGGYFRPLLGISREATRAVATERGLPFRDDPMNVDRSVRRNRLRLETIPHLADTYNPQVIQALARAAGAAASDDDTLAARADRVPIRVSDGAVLIPTGALKTLPEAIGSRVIRRGLRMAFGRYPGSSGDVEAVLGVVFEKGSGSLSNSLLATHEGAYVAIHPAEPATPPAPVEAELPGGASFGSWRFETSSNSARSGWSAVLPGGAVRIRSAEAGDVIAMKDGSKSVSEALREAGIAPRLRSQWPVVESGARIAWLVGVRTAHGLDAAGVRVVATRESA